MFITGTDGNYMKNTQGEKVENKPSTNTISDLLRMAISSETHNRVLRLIWEIKLNNNEETNEKSCDKAILFYLSKLVNH